MTLTEFKRFADENNIVPVSKEIYSQMISDSVKYAKIKEVLQEIRQEIASYKDDKLIHAERNEMIDIVLDIIDKYRAESEVRNE